MTSGLLLDTHALLWVENKQPVASGTLLRLATAAVTQSLYLSDISLWELGVGLTKRDIGRRPDLKGLDPDIWIRKFRRRFGCARLPLSAAIMAEASRVPSIYGSGDPGDCFLIATARIHNLALVTRDDAILKLAARDPGYLSVIPC
jgi:PIN domain nuclease of toxin-antitoxin system